MKEKPKIKQITEKVHNELEQLLKSQENYRRKSEHFLTIPQFGILFIKINRGLLNFCGIPSRAEALKCEICMN